MQAQGQATGKVCVRCGEDCAARARVKDPQGRYYCKECFSAAPAPPARRAVRATIPVEDEPIAPILLAAPAVVAMPTCPECERPMPAGTVLCTSCGYNSTIGRKMIAASGRRTKAEKREREEKQDASDVVKWAYLKPLLMFAVAAGSTFLIAAQNGLGSGSERVFGLEAGMAYLMSFAFTVPIGLLVFWLCSVMWIGVDAPLHLTAIRLAGVYAVVDLIQIGMTAAIGAPILGGIAVLALYVFLMMQVLDLEKVDAIMVAVLTAAARFAAVIALYAVFGGEA